jgi:hypothetical protein
MSSRDDPPQPPRSADDRVAVDPGRATSPASGPLGRRGFGPRWFPGPVRRNLPALVLVGLSILIPELLTGSTPVLSLFLDPLSILFLLGLYGCGVLTIREICVRRGKGWPSVLLLGLAYGIVEEGFGTKTFFDPHSTAAAGLAVYGHYGGVSWVWVTEITIFHAVFSIGLPILLVGLLFPGTRGMRYLSERGLGTAFTLFLLTATTMFFLFDRSYTPSAGVLLLFAALAIGLSALAWRSPSSLSRSSDHRALRSPRAVGLAAGLFVWSLFGISWLLPALVPAPVVVIGLDLLLAIGIALYVFREIESGDPHYRLAFATGALSFLIVFSLVVELLGDVLAFFATGFIIGLLVLLRRRVASYPLRPLRDAMGKPI